MTALPMKVPVSYQEIAHCLDKSISKIEAAVLSALEQTPPELYADIVKNGIYLAGGGALLRGIDKRLRDKMGIEFQRGRRSFACSSKRYGDCVEEYRQV